MPRSGIGDATPQMGDPVLFEELQSSELPTGYILIHLMYRENVFDFSVRAATLMP